MKILYKIKILENEFLLEELWSKYIFHNIFIVLRRNNIDFLDEYEFEIPCEILLEFKMSIQLSLISLLENLYIPPTDKIFQKRSYQFEKITFNNALYKLNYRLSSSDRMAFALFKLIEFIENGILYSSNAIVYQK